MVDLAWGSVESKKFITNVGLITSNGPHGQNVMAAEWTHHISYNPGMIAICLAPGKATADNIRESKEFGVNISSTEQNIVSSISGGSSGKNVNKIAVLKELGTEFYDAENIKVLMIKDSVLQLECKLHKEIQLGSHTMFVGEVVKFTSTDKEPLSYHGGKYFKLGNELEKPSEEERAKMKDLVEKNKK